MRYFIEFSYNGTHYHGWQIQKNAHTVQEELETALSRLLSRKISLIGSSRTDAGVHALQQFAYFNTDIEIADNTHLHKINAGLPKDIAVQHFRKVKEDAHARFNATSRSYEYRISLKKNPFLYKQCCFFFRPLDIKLMKEATKLLFNHDDFQAFSKVNTDVDHFLCTITHAEWEERDDLLIFRITSNRFLRGMVRTIVGTLLDIGREKTSVSDFEKIILSKDRKQAGAAAPPEGLFLTAVSYPEALFIEQPLC